MTETDFNFGANKEKTMPVKKVQKPTAKKAVNQKTDRGNPNGNYPDWLKVEEVPEEGLSVNILPGVRNLQNEWGYKLVFTVSNEELGERSFSIKPTNPGLRTIIDNLIAGNETMLEVQEYNGRTYVGVADSF